MWSECGILFVLYCIVVGDLNTPNVSNEKQNVVDEMASDNEVVNNNEKYNYEKKVSLSHTSSIKPLSAEDLKCILSKVRYCSEDMKEIKGVLIKAIQGNCSNCTEEQKLKAGKIISSMLIHHAAAWKTIVTMYESANKM